MPVIEFDGVGHAYPGADGRPRPALAEVTCRLTEHRIGVIGANGSGKSTFTRMINALVIPVTGSVTVDGLDTSRHRRDVRRSVGYCFSDPDAQIVMPTVAEDLAFGLRRRGMTKAAVAEAVTDTMAAYGLSGYADQPAQQLSGGEKQLLALAAVLITRPKIVILDEPTTLLDLGNAAAIRERIAQLPEQVLLVTHQLDLLSDMDRALVFRGGRVAFDGDPGAAVEFYRGLFR
ncbi:MAG: energy-coupling factor ABC transporter ATP-binding protein [Nostocoides sp.]